MNSYAWDRADRLLNVNGAAHQYAYNGLGQRVSQTVGGQVTRYLLDVQPGLWQVLASTTGADTTRFVHGPTGIQQQQNPNSTWVYLVQDGLGSVRGVVNAANGILEARHYDPYGQPRGSYDDTPFGFTGEPTDGNGLVYLRARYYSPMLGAFISQDPFYGTTVDAMSLNRYAFVKGNVTNAVDPTGFFALLTMFPPIESEHGLLIAGHVDPGDCLFCIGRALGYGDPELQYFSEVIAALPENRPVVYGDAKLRTGQGFLYIPSVFIKGYSSVDNHLVSPGFFDPTQCPGECASQAHAVTDSESRPCFTPGRMFSILPPGQSTRVPPTPGPCPTPWKILPDTLPTLFGKRRGWSYAIATSGLDFSVDELLSSNYQHGFFFNVNRSVGTSIGGAKYEGILYGAGWSTPSLME